MTAVHCTEDYMVLTGVTMQVRAMQCMECTQLELQWSTFLTIEEVCLSKS